MSDTIKPRYTVVHVADSWHVFDTRRNAPVAFSESSHEALARARAECYNHYWHLTLEEARCADTTAV